MSCGGSIPPREFVQTVRAVLRSGERSISSVREDLRELGIRPGTLVDLADRLESSGFTVREEGKVYGSAYVVLRTYVSGLGLP